MPPLHLEFRPQTLDEVVGNKATVDSLRSILSRDDRPHSYLLHGPSGCGKTTLARIMATMLGCDPLEFHELNTANTRGIDTVREKIAQAYYAPLSGSVKVYLWDEIHTQTGAAAEALLKFLEDTPTHVYNFLCTTNPEKLLKTIKNRCTTYIVSTLTSIEMGKLLNWVEENTGDELHADVRKALISAADGCPRRALVMMDQIVGIKNSIDQLAAIVNTTDEEPQIIDICRKLMVKEGGAKKWAGLAEMMRFFDPDPENARRAIMGYLSKVLLGCKGEEGKRIAQIMNIFSEPLFNSGKPGLIMEMYLATLV
jgi:DNA polymerase-3 subunit gamma/tau